MNRSHETGGTRSAARRLAALSAPAWLAGMLLGAQSVRADQMIVTPAGHRTLVEHVMLPGGVVEEYDAYIDRNGSRVKHGEYKRYYRNGDMRERITFVHGIEDGPFAVYQDGNIPLLEGRYVQGKLDGNVTRYFASGHKQRELTYRVGTLEGPFVLYHEGGVISAMGTHAQGKREGRYAEFHSNGQLRLEGTYVQGFLNGAIVMYSESGEARAKGMLSRERVRGPWICLAAPGKPEMRRNDCEGKQYWECACD